MDLLMRDQDIPLVIKIFCFLPLLLIAALILLVRAIISLIIERLIFGLFGIDI